MTKNKSSRLDFSTKLKVLEALKLHCSKGDDGFAKYEDGWDDARLAAQFAAPVNPTHIKNLRREQIGSLREARMITTGDMGERLTQIEDYLTRQHPEWRDLAKRLI